jgi:hypothetical protein
MWYFELSGPCNSVHVCQSGALMSLCCTTCAWWEQAHEYKYGGHYIFKRVPSCTDEAYVERRNMQVCRYVHIEHLLPVRHCWFLRGNRASVAHSSEQASFTSEIVVSILATNSWHLCEKSQSTLYRKSWYCFQFGSDQKPQVSAANEPFPL